MLMLSLLLANAIDKLEGVFKGAAQARFILLSIVQIGKTGGSKWVITVLSECYFTSLKTIAVMLGLSPFKISLQCCPLGLNEWGKNIRKMCAI